MTIRLQRVDFLWVVHSDHASIWLGYVTIHVTMANDAP